MTNRLKHNLWVILIYTIIIYVIISPFGLWLTGIPISFLIAFFFNMLNDIIMQLRKLNGEKFPYLEDSTEDQE